MESGKLPKFRFFDRMTDFWGFTSSPSSYYAHAGEAIAKTGSDMSKVALVQEWLQAIWCGGNLALIDEIFVENGTACGSVSDFTPNAAGVRDITENILELIKRRPRFEYLVAEELGDLVVLRFFVHVDDHPYRPPFKFSAAMIYRLKGDKIAELHTQIDYFALFEGVGQLPEDALPVSLSGAELTWAA